MCFLCIELVLSYKILSVLYLVYALSILELHHDKVIFYPFYINEIKTNVKIF